MSTDLVIILSSDWVGSTQARADLGEDTADTVQEVHDVLLRRVIAAEGGTVVKHYGDGVMATFNSATAALAAAVKIQHDFAAYRESPDALTRMDVRVGLAIGDVKHQAGDIFGLPVVEAVRLQSSAAPNEILCSDLVRVLSQGRGGFEFEDAGVLNLKGLPEPVHALRVHRPDGPRAASAPRPPAATLPRPPPGQGGRPRRMRPYVLVASVALAALLGAGAWLALRYAPAPDPAAASAPSPGSVPPPPVTAEAPAPAAASQRIANSIAVLPFTNLSPDEDDAYFALALHDEVLNQLVKATDLIVTSRTTMARYANTDKGMRDIGAELNVETVMEGSVYRAGDTIRVTMQLIDAVRDVHLWSDSYERNVTDVATVIAIQADIARNVARALDIELSAGEQANISQVPTQSSEAYERYLAALAIAETSPDGALRTLDLIEQALALDAEFAPAWVVAANTNTVLLSWFPQDSERYQSAGERAARRALELDPALPAAHAALGYVLFQKGDWIGSEAAFREARRRNMPLGDMAAYSVLQMSMGNFRGARETLMENRVITPQNSVALSFLIDANAFLGEWDIAWQQFTIGRQLFPRWDFGVQKIALWLVGRGDAAALKGLDTPNAPVLTAMINSFDDTEVARQDLRRMIELPESANAVNRTQLAVWAAALGEAELALDTMRQATRQAGGQLIYAWLPQFDDVRRTPEFKQLLRDLGVVEYWNTYGWQDVCRKLGDDDFECTWVSPR